MKRIVFVFLGSCSLLFAQSKSTPIDTPLITKSDWESTQSLTQNGAIKVMLQANALATTLNKKIAVAVLDASGRPLLLTIADGVGPHNFEAARRKAFTALSTKTSTLLLSRNAKANPDTQNLNTLPELLLLGGGVPIIVDNKVIGSVGIAGAGGPEQDDAIAQKIVTLFK